VVDLERVAEVEVLSLFDSEPSVCRRLAVGEEQLTLDLASDRTVIFVHNYGPGVVELMAGSSIKLPMGGQITIPIEQWEGPVRARVTPDP
jgi:hypothetical protein